MPNFARKFFALLLAAALVGVGVASACADCAEMHPAASPSMADCCRAPSEAGLLADAWAPAECDCCAQKGCAPGERARLDSPARVERPVQPTISLSLVPVQPVVRHGVRVRALASHAPPRPGGQPVYLQHASLLC